MRILLLAAATAALASPDLPSGIPGDWASDYLGADLMFSNLPIERYMPEVGNGNIAAKITSEKMYMAGVFCGHTPPLEKKQVESHRAAITSPIKLDLLTETKNGVHALQIRKGMFISRFTLEDDSHLEIKYYAHRALKSLLVADMSWWGSSDSSSIEFKSPIPIRDKCFLEAVANTTETKYGTVTTWTAITTSAETNTSTVTVSISYMVGDQNVTIKNGSSVSFISSFRSSLDSKNPAADSVADWLKGMDIETEQLRESHTSEWKKLWTGGLEIDRFDVARAFNTSMYFIMASVRDDVYYSLSPGGLASDGYWGHSFWDCETWMYPPMLMFQPEIARSLLQYRYERIPAAAHKARSKGYNGTNFPWESAFTGEEVCNDVEATFEQHINSDIVLAVKQFYQMTGDKQWLRSTGFPILEGVANFWTSRVEYDNEGKAHIHNIQGPDEWAVNVTDSVYTNYGAVAALRFASEASQILTGSENPIWTAVADKIVIPTYSPELQMSIHPEYSGFKGGVGTVKQADVILLGFPFDLKMNSSLRRNDLKFYLNVTTGGGPAMTWGIFSIGFTEIGEEQLAHETFNRSFANVKQPYDVWTETPHGGAVNFITGAGGWLQTALFGYSGLRIRPSFLEINPKLINLSTTNKIRGIRYLSAVIDFIITETTLTVGVQNGVEVLITDTKTSKTFTTTTHVTLPISAYTVKVV